RKVGSAQSFAVTPGPHCHFWFLRVEFVLEVSRRRFSGFTQAGRTVLMTIAQPETQPADIQIAADAQLLSAQLAALRGRLFPPTAMKTLRSFTSGEAAKLIGVSDGYLRQLSISGEGPQPEVGPGGRRHYSLADVNALRHHLAGQSAAKAKQYIKWRQPGEHLQVIAITNFKGGSGKTTTSAHLAQYFALQGYRTLAIDLDPQASMSALFG